ncbi:uncharacterized protein DNG_00944 [Cephalotrichum gorgonifer]|uniref:Uncharacterized protein n=1 Tax=Cephalotrichum gorgonifer TaxID=2041049 RepID=A0AAE8MQB7_9PEZI|nr:uncharacterized protein DNG_00944 [Cephalotrichum gorgonifer]
MDRPQESSQAAGGAASSGYTTTAPTTTAHTRTPAPADGQLSSQHQARRRRQSGDQSTATSAISRADNPADSRSQATSASTTSTLPDANSHATPRPKQHKQHTSAPPGRLHTRVPSSKALKHHHSTGQPAAKLNPRRPNHHQNDEPQTTTYTTSRHTHRRAQSDVKLVRGIPQSTNLRRNRSHLDVVAKRNKSSDKLRGLTAARSVPRHSTGVRFEPGAAKGDGSSEEDDDDEWVDDSVTASPYPRTPREPPSQNLARAAALSPTESTGSPAMSAADREIAQHKEYLTSRLLRRTPSQNVPPHMSPTVASAPRSHRLSPDNLSQESTAPATPNPASGGEEEDGPEGLTSRFITGPGSTFTRDGSFYTQDSLPSAGRSLDAAAAGLRRPRSLADLAREDPGPRRDPSEGLNGGDRRNRRAPPAEVSRTQRKLNLQRASSNIEPQPLSAAPSVMGSSTATLVGIPAPGYDGISSRDPRLSRLLEKTGMEYRVVRRYQNPLLRSISRLEHVPGWDAQQRVTSRPGHARNVSLPPSHDGPDRPPMPLRTQSSRFIGRERAAQGPEAATVGRDPDIGITTALRNLWEKPLDLSASQ